MAWQEGSRSVDMIWVVGQWGGIERTYFEIIAV